MIGRAGTWRSWGTSMVRQLLADSSLSRWSRQFAVTMAKSCNLHRVKVSPPPFIVCIAGDIGGGVATGAANDIGLAAADDASEGGVNVVSLEAGRNDPVPPIDVGRAGGAGATGGVITGAGGRGGANALCNDISACREMMARQETYMRSSRGKRRRSLLVIILLGLRDRQRPRRRSRADRGVRRGTLRKQA